MTRAGPTQHPQSIDRQTTRRAVSLLRAHTKKMTDVQRYLDTATVQDHRDSLANNEKLQSLVGALVRRGLTPTEKQLHDIRSKFVAGLVMHIDTSAEPAKATTIYDGGNGRSFVEQTETQEELNKLFSFRTSYNTVQQKPSFQLTYS